jgi:hypothetical protein
MGTGRTYRVAGVQSASAAAGTSVTLTLNQILPASYATGSATLIPGCDLSGGPSGCGKYGNYINFGGHEFVPATNPTLTALPAPTSGNKK